MASKNQPNLIVSAAGWLMQFATLLIKGLMARGWDNDRIHALVTDRGAVGMNLIIESVLEALAPQGTFPQLTLEDFKRGDFRLPVDLDKPLEEMLADGKFNVSMNGLNENTFPSLGSGSVEVMARLYPVKDMSSADALFLLDQDGYRPATFIELLAFGILSKEIRLDVSVVAHGSYMPCGPADHSVACFHDSDGFGWSRYLRGELVQNGDCKWRTGVCFLAIRKK